jgi:glycosyltransferase involved in cell wall biosynthesis
VVQKECDRLGIILPPGHEHAYDAAALKREEEEYQLAFRLLCPSDFVVKTFLDQGFAKEKLVRHIYGVDDKKFHPDDQPRERKRGLTMISVGLCAVRKGLHYALEAWLQSPASREGTFLIAGDFLPAYREKLSAMLAHPSVRVLGQRDDVPELMRQADIMVLASIEEGSALVCTEAMASGCVPLISDRSSGICRHMENSLVHPVGDVAALAQHITLMHQDQALLARLRAEGLRTIPGVTWKAAGVKLLDVYRDTIQRSTRHARDGGTPNKDRGVKMAILK